jgi:hypothetical protein
MANPSQNLMLSTCGAKNAACDRIYTFNVRHFQQLAPDWAGPISAPSIFLIADRFRGCGGAYAVTCHEGELDGYLAGSRMVPGDQHARFCHKLTSLSTWPTLPKALKFRTRASSIRPTYRLRATLSTFWL